MAYMELADGFQIDYDAKGITGQRQFIESDNVPAGNESVTIPVIGDIFHDPAEKLQHLFCVKITQKYVVQDRRKILFTCFYSNEPVDNSNMKLEYVAPTSPSELPQTVDYSGEFQLWKAPTATTDQIWRWENAGGEGIKAIPFRIRTYNKKISRIIPEAQYKSFVDNIQEMVGKVNASATTDEDLGIGGAACWLFLGGRSELFRDQRDGKAYLFDLNFVYRDPDGTDESGWQKILNEKGEWKQPFNSTTSKHMYETTNFKPLFS